MCRRSSGDAGSSTPSSDVCAVATRIPDRQALISRVHLLVSLTGPASSGSADTSRRCQGCSHPHQRLLDQAALSFTQPLRRPGDEGLSPPSDFRRSAAAPVRPRLLLVRRRGWAVTRGAKVSPRSTSLGCGSCDPHDLAVVLAAEYANVVQRRWQERRRTHRSRRQPAVVILLSCGVNRSGALYFAPT